VNEESEGKNTRKRNNTRLFQARMCTYDGNDVDGCGAGAWSAGSGCCKWGTGLSVGTIPHWGKMIILRDMG
jgi:hypothetical protein